MGRPLCCALNARLVGEGSDQYTPRDGMSPMVASSRRPSSLPVLTSTSQRSLRRLAALPGNHSRPAPDSGNHPGR